jgi:hypothetical protein
MLLLFDTLYPAYLSGSYSTEEAIGKNSSGNSERGVVSCGRHNKDKDENKGVRILTS